MSALPLLRLADLNDSHQLADLRWRLNTEDATEFDTTERDRFVAAFVKAFPLDNDQFTYWVAEVKDRLVAAMAVRTVRKVPAPDNLEGCWGYLTNSYTLPQYRNRGIGSSLLAAVKTWADQQRLELLLVWPSDRAYPFYERAGFNRYQDPLILKLR